MSLGIFLLSEIAIISFTFIYMRLSFQQMDNNRWLIVGANQKANQLRQDLASHNPSAKFVMLAEGVPNAAKDEKSNSDYQGSIRELPSWSNKSLSGVVIATQTKLAIAEMQSLSHMLLQGIPIYQVPEFYEKELYKIRPEFIKDEWFDLSKGFKLISSQFHQNCKRFIDIVAAVILLVVLSPLMLLAAIAIKLDSPGRLVYSQIRTGINGKTFRVYKFRSMYQDAEKMGAQWTQERDPRITNAGRFLRLTRIDELPQLWNVLNGEMSLIGPRPERPEFDVQLAEVIPHYNMRYSVKPGITGWAQVMYPYGASVDDAREKLSYDLFYIKNYSFALDLVIVLKTIGVVLLGKGR